MYQASKNDTISPKSVSGLLAAYATNGSYVFSGFTKLYLNEDQWRITAAAGIGRFNFQYYEQESDLPIGSFYDYESDFRVIGARLEKQVWNDFYIGAAFGFTRSMITFENLLEDDIVQNQALQLSFISDSRSDVYYPRNGHLAKFLTNFRPDWLANENTTYSLELVFNRYFPVRNNKDIIAVRARADIGLGDIEFNEEVIIGRVDLRGYSDGKYRGERVFTLQGEYRWNFANRWSAVGFGGVATLDGSINESFNWDLYPSIGSGIRFNIFKNDILNIGIDGAWGKDDFNLYFRIGEAF